jgi:hypothetical protein
MASTPTVYRSDDTSAPSLTRELGSLSDLLEAILVDGYGSKSAAGWTVAFTGTNEKMFRNDTVNGTGVYLRVDDSAPWNTTSYGAAIVSLYETASAVDTGTGRTPAVDYPFEFYFLGSVSTTAMPWICIADDRTFYFASSYNNTDTGSTGTPDFLKDATYTSDVMHFWAGDFDSYLNSDGYASFIAIFNNNTTSPTCYSNYWKDSVHIDGGYVFTLRQIDRVTHRSSPVNSPIVHGMNSSSTPGYMAYYNVAIRDDLSNDYTDEMHSQFNYGEVLMSEYITTSQGVLRGKFRGLIDGPFAGNFNSVKNYSGETKTVDSRNLVGVRVKGGTGFWVETTTDSWS